MSKRIRKLPEEQREQFQAYGEYTYDYVHQPDGQEPQASPGPETEKPMTVQAAKARRCRRKTEGFFKFLVVLAILTVTVVVVQEKFFRLKTVYVIGNETQTPQQVVAASGLVQGRNMLGIEEQDVARAISKDHTIIFKGMQKEYPGTIYLYIEERKTVAAMQWLGVLYLLDGEGMVMQQQSGSDLPEGLPVVTGFRASNIYVGQKLMVRSQNQLDAYCKIMYELEQQLYGDQVSEINLADPEDIYLITREGITVRMGNADYMRAKIGAVRTYMAYLRQLGKCSGVLDVTLPEDAKFMPEK